MPRLAAISSARPPHLTLAALLLLLALTCGCSPRERALGDPLDPYQPERAWVETLRDRLDTPLKTLAEARQGRASLDALLDAEAKHPWNKRVQSGIKYADLFQRLYRDHGHIKLMASYQGLTPRGQLAVERLRAASEHHIDEPMDYHLAAIDALHAQLQELSASRQPLPPLVLTPEEIEALTRFCSDQQLAPHTPAAEQAIIEALLGPVTESPAPRISRYLEEMRQEVARSTSLSARLELLVADGLLRYARDMKLFNLNRMSWKELKAAGGSKKVIYARLGALWTSLKDTPPEETPALLDTLLPAHPDYLPLIALRQRYLASIADNSWPKPQPIRLTLETRSPAVLTLRQRLALDGYLPTPLPDAPDADRVDQPLLDAVAAYHLNHQLPYTAPTPHKQFWKKLTQSPDTLMQKIELNIERLRESRYEGEPDYVFVNLPDFHAEVFAAHQQKLRFKVVIGKNNRKCDPEKNRFVYPNATPELMSKLEHFILNPSWYVPERIIEEEIKPNVEKDETWLARNNYEIVKKKGDHWIVRQTPGEHNALGLVKFIFPNPHNTYMHDTAKKQYFDFQIRAYSHGCMRVHQPLDLARYLIDFDQQTDLDLDAIIASKQSKMVKLKRDLPVFVEYHTVQFDEQQRASFLYDIYDHDARALSPDPAAFDRCNGAALLKRDESPDEGSPADVERDNGP